MCVCVTQWCVEREIQIDSFRLSLIGEERGGTSLKEKKKNFAAMLVSPTSISHSATVREKGYLHDLYIDSRARRSSL